MEALIIEKTEETPTVILDASQNIFKFSETSWPEDATKFYQPILEWFESYFRKPNVDTVLEFSFTYFNTASAKQLARLFTAIELHTHKSNVLVKWYYDKEDTDMQKSGNRFAKLLKINFSLIELSS